LGAGILDGLLRLGNLGLLGADRSDEDSDPAASNSLAIDFSFPQFLPNSYTRTGYHEFLSWRITKRG
jgi:hypothetical protein